MLFPSPLVGEGGEIEWNEIEPGEGALNTKQFRKSSRF